MAVLDRVQKPGMQHHHSSGTAAMGKAVYSEGNVIRIEKLKIVDVGIIPLQ